MSHLAPAQIDSVYHSRADTTTDDEFLSHMNFWESMRPWFLDRGYTLYLPKYIRLEEELDSISYTYPATAKPSEIGRYPYASYGGGMSSTQFEPLNALPLSRVVFAQDSGGRHVAIKLVKNNSDEHRILKLIGDDPCHRSIETFQGILPPLEFLQYDDYWFVVTPRWGNQIYNPPPSTIGDILRCIHCTLKALNYLHKHLIVHRDISLKNILANHIISSLEMYPNDMRTRMRSRGELMYAFIDFNISIIFPRTSTDAERRLPSELSWWGGENQPFDTAQGELDYDPFAFDVGCLGTRLRRDFSRYTCDIPILAPLFDGMTMRNIDRRFTASQALQFFEENLHPHEPYPPYALSSGARSGSCNDIWA